MMIIHEDHIHHDDHNNQVDAVWSGMIIHDDHCDEKKMVIEIIMMKMILTMMMGQG